MRPPGRHRPRVLLLEDEPADATDLALNLQSLGYEVLGPCRTVDEARAAAAAHRPDAAILDAGLTLHPRPDPILSQLRDADVAIGFIAAGRVPTAWAGGAPVLRRKTSLPEMDGILKEIVAI